MRLTELLTPERVSVHTSADETLDKEAAIARLAQMLGDPGSGPVSVDAVERVLVEREQLQSTGIGDGVAIPHGALAELDKQRAALLIVPHGIGFDAIDGQRVNLLFAVIGPKRATGEHLKTLARISRLLRNKSFRQQLLEAPNGERAFELLVAEESEQR